MDLTNEERVRVHSGTADVGPVAEKKKKKATTPKRKAAPEEASPPSDGDGPPQPGVVSGKRAIKSRFIEIDGHTVNRLNNYTLEQGERSAWDQELSKGFQAEGHSRVDPAAAAKAAAAKAAAAAAKAAKAAKPSVPRQLSAVQQGARNRADEIKRDAAEDAVKRTAFVQAHWEVIAPFSSLAQCPTRLGSRLGMAAPLSGAAARKAAEAKQARMSLDGGEDEEEDDEMDEEAEDEKGGALTARGGGGGAGSKSAINDWGGDEASLGIENPAVKVQPAFINGTMRPHQMICLNWLIHMHDHGTSCILADEMGLGKTMQTLSLLAYLKNVRGIDGPHLIVCPLSVLSTWVNEIKRFTPRCVSNHFLLSCFTFLILNLTLLPAALLL